MKRNLLLLLLLAACSKKAAPAGDDCQRFVDKSRAVLEGMLKSAGKGSAADLDKLVTECRAHAGKPGNKDDAMMKCVLDAKDDPAVAACWAASLTDYQEKGKATEAKLRLNRLGKNAKVAFITNAEFPKGQAGPSPAQACCSFPDHKCPVTTDWAQNPVWAALDFSVDEPALFQYSYESDGKTATATAIGDLDCDGTSITYKLELSAVEGNPKMELIEPAPNAD